MREREWGKRGRGGGRRRRGRKVSGGEEKRKKKSFENLFKKIKYENKK